MLKIPDLQNIFQADIYASSICNNDNFWYKEMAQTCFENPNIYSVNIHNNKVIINITANFKIKNWKTMVFTLPQSNQIIIDIFSLKYKFELPLSPQITSGNIVSLSLINFYFQV
jgi:hypothetical protein